MNNKRDISIADLMELLQDNDITGFDPVYEAFRAYDTNNEGFIPVARLRDIFSAFGLGELSSTEVEILTKVIWPSNLFF
jgi:Ca2+-binding EF-hand superfamily protein